MRISDWSSDVCSSDLLDPGFRGYGDAPEATLPDDELDRRIRAYIVENPEVIVEAMQRLQARQRTAAASEAEAVLRARADEVFQDAASPVGGKPDGDVKLVEFFDYNCPFCRSVDRRRVVKGTRGAISGDCESVCIVIKNRRTKVEANNI